MRDALRLARRTARRRATTGSAPGASPTAAARSGTRSWRGVPFAAAETWSRRGRDLYSALVPQNLAKSGDRRRASSRARSRALARSIAGGRRGTTPSSRRPRAVECSRGAAVGAPAPWSDHNAGLHDAGPPRLRLRPRPGDARRTRALAGPKALWVGQLRPRAVNVPGSRHCAMIARRAIAWFDRYLARHARTGSTRLRSRRARRAREQTPSAFAARLATKTIAASALPRHRRRSHAGERGRRGAALRCKAALETFGASRPARGRCTTLVGGAALVRATAGRARTIIVASGGLPTHRQGGYVHDHAGRPRRPSCRKARVSRVTVARPRSRRTRATSLYLDFRWCRRARRARPATIRAPGAHEAHRPDEARSHCRSRCALAIAAPAPPSPPTRASPRATIVDRRHGAALRRGRRLRVGRPGRRRRTSTTSTRSGGV